LHRASEYDSFYLAIAEEFKAELWTADKRLINSLQDHKPTWLHWAGEIEP
jgi:predicted nucleic acid-binding protein